MDDETLMKLEKVLENRNCEIYPQTSVLELCFEDEEDAKWFENAVEETPKDSAISCLMTMTRLGNRKSRFRYVFNIVDADNFIKMLEDWICPF